MFYNPCVFIEGSEQLSKVLPKRLYCKAMVLRVANENIPAFQKNKTNVLLSFIHASEPGENETPKGCCFMHMHFMQNKNYFQQFLEIYIWTSNNAKLILATEGAKSLSLSNTSLGV